MPWAPTILQQFEVADQDSTNISQYCGPYNTFLTDPFPHTEGFQVAPAFKAPMTPDSIDFTTRFIIRRYRAIELPVFFLDVKPTLHTDDISTRKKADEQIREYFESIVGQNLVIPKLYGISAIGTRFSVYNYDKATGILSPPSSSRDSMQLVDVAPVNQWNFDLLEKTGEEKFKEIVAEVKVMCEAVTAYSSTHLIQYFAEASKWIDPKGSSTRTLP